MPRSNLSSDVVISAAATLADRTGFDAVTVAAVARHLGVQPASLYEHVKSRDALLDAVHRLALGELASRVSEELAGRSGKAALQGLVDAYRNFATQRPGAWAALQRVASPDTARSPEAAGVAALMLAVIRGYPVPEPALVHAARLVAATVRGYLILSESEVFNHRPDGQDESWLAAVDALDRALSTWPSEGTPS
ncbi:TetR/AcrR family transcriptional regulator [Arthrobacter frigidicola]|nr:TetR/AcrR family transcriptional regulator [Arthrobacter frigidicola]